jgi:hypothetical protein
VETSGYSNPTPDSGPVGGVTSADQTKEVVNPAPDYGFFAPAPSVTPTAPDATAPSVAQPAPEPAPEPEPEPAPEPVAESANEPEPSAASAVEA